MTTQATNLNRDVLDQQYALRSAKRLALGVLLMATLVFILTKLAQHNSMESAWIGWLQAFSEAAMIGGIADWFAVVALFRHPLGVPIPHTAIIPRSKERIAQSMGVFIQDNFLSKNVLGKKIKELNILQRICSYLGDPIQSEKLAAYLQNLVLRFLRSSHDEKLLELLGKLINQSIHSTRLGPVVRDFVKGLIDSRQNRGLFNQFLIWIESIVSEHSNYIRETLGRELPWYVPKFVHDRVYASILERVRTVIIQINSDSNHPVHDQFDSFLRSLIDNEMRSGEFDRWIDSFKLDLLKSPGFKNVTQQAFNALRSALEDDLNKENSSIKSVLNALILTSVQELENDLQLRSKVESIINDAAMLTIDRYHDRVAEFISDTVRSWKPSHLIEKVELQIGPDLQYIRLNGALVGGFVGLIIYTIGLILG